MIHRYMNIPGWFLFQDIYDRAVAHFPSGSHFVEVGSWKGRSAAYMAVSIANSGKDIQFDCVDTFKGSIDHHGKFSAEGLYEQFKENTRGLHLNVRVQSSLDAAAEYADASLDFVFLDASHEAIDVMADIHAWKPKLKPDGVLAGDDWGAFQAVRQGIFMANLSTFRSHVDVGWIHGPESWKDPGA